MIKIKTGKYGVWLKISDENNTETIFVEENDVRELITELPRCLELLEMEKYVKNDAPDSKSRTPL